MSERSAPIALPSRNGSRFARREHLGVDVRDVGIHWAVGRMTAFGLRPIRCGDIPLAEHGDHHAQLRELIASGFGRGLHLEVAFHSNELRHERLELPALSRKEARAVARRRLVPDPPDPEQRVVLTVRYEDGSATAWCGDAPVAQLEPKARAWADRGSAPHRVSSRHLALGDLAGVIRRPDDGLIAVFDLESEFGTCVVADEQGWLFSREVPFKFMGDRFAHAVPVDEHDAVDAAIRDVGWEGASGLELEHADGQTELESDVRERLAHVAADAERLDTELRRTFQYVEGELRMARVTRVLLAGESDELPELAPALERSLGLSVELIGDAAAELGVDGATSASAVAMGLVSAPDRSCGNMLPEPWLRRARQRRVRSVLTRTLAAGALLVVLAAAFVLGRSAQLRSEAESLELRWLSSAPEREAESQLAAVTERGRALTAYMSAIDREGPAWVETLELLGRAAPDAVRLERFRSAREGGAWSTQLVVEATGRSLSEAASAVSDYSTLLEDAPGISVDEVSSEDDAGAPGESARVRFRVDGRLAVAREELPHG